jgi:hypothetical protein
MQFANYSKDVADGTVCFDEMMQQILQISALLVNPVVKLPSNAPPMKKKKRKEKSKYQVQLAYTI